MKRVFCAVALALLCCRVESKASATNVRVYSQNPAELGKTNILTCLVKNFHPPEITIELLRNNELITDADQTDLSFNKEWQFHLSKHATINPANGDKYACRVTHTGKVQDYAWESNM